MFQDGGGLGPVDAREGRGRGGDLAGDLERRPLVHAGQAQRDVGRVVAVLRVGGALEGHRRARGAAQLLLEAA